MGSIPPPIRADQLRVGDVVRPLDRPPADWPDRRRRVHDVRADDLGWRYITFLYPSSSCPDECRDAPGACPHYGEGGFALAEYPAGYEFVPVWVERTAEPAIPGQLPLPAT